MSLFKWFSGKSVQSKTAGDNHNRSALPVRLDSPQSATKYAVDTANRVEERKAKRHARREQLYVAVRESMTHAGVLSASYNFKVLALDQVGNQFLVMMDVDETFDIQTIKVSGIESKIVQTAEMRFQILVTSVYWRINAKPGMDSSKAPVPEPVLPVMTFVDEHANPPNSPYQKPALPRSNAIGNDETTLFKQAFAAAAVNAELTDKIYIEPHAHTTLTDFEDTARVEAYNTPVLSNTQYGDLL